MADETKIIRIVVDSSAAIDGSRKATDALARMERSLDQSKTALDRMDAGLGRIGGLMKAQLALGLAAVSAAFISMARDAFNAAAGMGELADQMGVTTQGLQALQFSAVQNGLKLEQLETGISKFSQKMGEAADGSKEMIEALDKVGVKILDAKGQLLPTEQLLGQVASKIMALDDPAKRVAASVDFFGKSGARMLPMLSELADGMDKMKASAQDAGAMIDDSVIKALDKVADKSETTKLKVRTLFAEFGAPIVTATLTEFNKVLESTRREIEAIQKAWSWLTGGPSADTLGARAKTLQATIDAMQSGAAGPQDELSKARLSGLYRQLGEVQQQISDKMTAGYVPTLPSVTVTADGDRNPTIKGAGASEGDAIAKALRAARLDVDTQKALAEASERGAKAVADLEVHFKALKAAQDAYGKTADQNTAGVAALTAELEKMMAAADKAKAIKDFNIGTADLEKVNELLAAENQLINASAEDRARELALIKTRQEILSKGLDESNAKEREAIERRHAAIEQNERLKAQGEELKKANEIWTAPLKSALESIQRTGADMWEQMLENGRFSAEEFGQIFAKMARRAAAELLALATIRPVINVAIGGLGSLGLVSPGTASALGYGGAGGGVGGLGSLGGGGGFGSLSGSLGSFGQWLNTPFTGPYAGISPAGMQGVPVAANTASGLTPLGAIGGLASMGMGAYSLATSRSTGGKVGGAAGLLGGAMGIAGMMLPGLSALGPIGMGVGLLGSLLGGLFGGGGEQIPPMPPLDYGAGVISPAGAGFSYSGNALNGGRGMGGAAASIGGQLQGFFRTAGLTAVPGMLIGGDLASGMNSVWGNGGWQQSPYTQAGLQLPGGGYERLTYNDSSRTIEQAADLLIAAMFKANVLRGGVSGASQSLMTAVSTAPLNTAKDVQNLVEFVAAYEKLGKATVNAKDAIEKLGDQFGQMSALAAGTYGLSDAPVAAEYNKQKFRYAQDFIDGMLDPMAVQLRALQDEKDSAIASAEYIRDVVGGVYVDINKITDYWLKKETDLRVQYYQQSYGQLQSLIDRLTYGDLANASASTSFAGQKASYMATLAQARAGNSTAAGNLAGVAEAYATSGRSYFGSSAEYAALAEQIRKDLIAQQVAVLGNDNGSADLKALAVALQKEQQARAANDSRLAELTAQVSALVAQLARR